MYPDDVSPPSSSYTDDKDRSGKSSAEVSPIVDTPSPLVIRRPANTIASSSIPVPKKTQRYVGAGALLSNLRGKTLGAETPTQEPAPANVTRWDTYSGERTTSEKGKPGRAATSPIKFNAELGSVRTPDVFLGNSTLVSGGSGPGHRKVMTKTTPTKAKEEWKGASGRHKIINPLADKPLPPGKAPIYPAGSEIISRTFEDRPKQTHIFPGGPHKYAKQPVSDEAAPKGRSNSIAELSDTASPPYPISATHSKSFPTTIL